MWRFFFLPENVNDEDTQDDELTTSRIKRESDPYRQRLLASLEAFLLETLEDSDTGRRVIFGFFQIDDDNDNDESMIWN